MAVFQSLWNGWAGGMTRSQSMGHPIPWWRIKNTYHTSFQLSISRHGTNLWRLGIQHAPNLWMTWLILLRKKSECRGAGKDSRADREFSREEFKQVLVILSSSDDFDRRYRYTTMLKFMVHLIARGDDASHVFASTLAVSVQYPWTLTTRLRWSKIVRERRSCPIQIDRIYNRSWRK